MPNVLITGCSSGIGRALADTFNNTLFPLSATALNGATTLEAAHAILTALETGK